MVEDEPPIRRLLRTSLGAQGYRILEAETGQGALDLLAHEAPEVMLLDLGAVMQRHVPAGEVDHLAAEADVGCVQRSLFWHKYLGCVVRVL